MGLDLLVNDPPSPPFSGFELWQGYGYSTSHEAYTGKLAVYKIIEALAGIGVGGAQVAYDILKEKFAVQGGGTPIIDNP